jgi:predicted membrane protein
VATRRKWPFLPLTAFLGTVLLVGQWWDGFYGAEHRGAALGGTGLLWFVYFVLPAIGSPRPGFWGTARTLVSVANGLLFSWVLYAILDPGYTVLRGPLIALLALAYVSFGSLLGGRRGRIPPVRALQYTGIVLAVLAVPIQFDLAWITLGWSLMALLLVWIGTESGDRGDRLLAYAVTVIVIFRVLVFDTMESFDHLSGYRPLLSGSFLVGLAAVVAVGGIAGLLHRRRDRLPAFERRLVPVFVLTAAALLLWRLSVESVAIFAAREDLSGVSTELASLLTLSLLWAVYAGILIGIGFYFRYRPIRYLGMGILGLLILKVFLLDREALERGYRIASFVGVGVLLLLISILYQKERKA